MSGRLIFIAPTAFLLAVSVPVHGAELDLLVSSYHSFSEKAPTRSGLLGGSGLPEPNTTSDRHKDS